MSKKYILEVFDYISSWEGTKIINKTELLRKLKVGDIVRLMFLGLDDKKWFVKVYFEIIGIDRYQYGGITNPRKFTGKCLDIYNPIHNESIEHRFGIKYGQVIQFNTHNILEIPMYHNRIWSSEVKDIVQDNYKKIQKYLIDVEMEEMQMEAIKMKIYDQKKYELRKLIKELKNTFMMTSKECENIICEFYQIKRILDIPVNWSKERIGEYVEFKYTILDS